MVVTPIPPFTHLEHLADWYSEEACSQKPDTQPSVPFEGQQLVPIYVGGDRTGWKLAPTLMVVYETNNPAVNFSIVCGPTVKLRQCFTLLPISGRKTFHALRNISISYPLIDAALLADF